MNTQIESLHFNADAKLQDFILKKTSTFDKFFNGIESCQVTLKLEKNDQRKNKVVEVSLNVPNKRLFAKENADTFENATDMVVDDLKQQLKSYKEKIKAL